MKISLLILSLLAGSWAHAFDLAAGLTPPKFIRPSLSYTGLFHQSAAFPPESAKTSYQSADLTVPVFKDEDQAYLVSLSGSEMKVDPEQSGYSSLYDLKIGASYVKSLDEQRQWSLSLRYGSASDKPFSSADVSTFGTTWLYSKPASEVGRWLFLVDYSNNRPILNNIPLPGFAYFYTPSKDFRATFGAPFASLSWNFAEKWGLDAFTLVPWVIKSSVHYKFTEHGRIYTGIDFSQITYYLANRSNKKERLFFDEKKIFVGIKSPLARFLIADLEFGHAFDRAFFTSEEYKIDPENPITLGNAYYGKLSLRFMF